MRTFSLAFLLFLLASSFSLAQKALGSLQIGLVAGPNHTFFNRQYYPFPEYEIKSDYRWAAGFSGKYQFSKHFIKMDLLYEAKAFAGKSILVGTNGNAYKWYVDNWNFTYMNLPVLIGKDIQNTGLFINAGPFLGLLLSQTTRFDDLNTDFSAKIDNTSTWKRLDYGISGGIGYSRAINSTLNLSAEVRHNLGLQNIAKSSVSYKSRSTNLLLGLHYSLGSRQ